MYPPRETVSGKRVEIKVVRRGNFYGAVSVGRVPARFLRGRPQQSTTMTIKHSLDCVSNHYFTARFPFYTATRDRREVVAAAGLPPRHGPVGVGTGRQGPP